MKKSVKLLHHWGLIAALAFAICLATEAAADVPTILYAQTESANLRHGPSTESDVAAQLKRGDKVLELERKGGWIKVLVSTGNVKTKGWIHSSLVEASQVHRGSGDETTTESTSSSRGGGSSLSTNLDENIDRMTSYAVLLVRAAGCGMNIDQASRGVGRWFDMAFQGNEKAVYLRILADGMTYHAELQSRGQTPDTCSDVHNTFNKMDWQAMPPG